MIQAQTPVAHSEQHNYTKDKILRLIVADEIQPLFLRPHLDKKRLWAFLCGWIGDRGGGKSASCAVTSVIDHMMRGRSVYSNMDIKCTFNVPDELARKHHSRLSGGIVEYKSLPLDKEALLNLDERYYRSCLVIEEINVEYSNVRRAMSNTNVDFNQVAQQLRHLEASLLYNVIDEMFIDPQLRSLSDAFIKTNDTAFNVDNLAIEKPRGIDFKWIIYPMTGYIAGEENRYKSTGKALPAKYFHFAPWQGIYNDIVNQKKEIYSISTKEKNQKILARMSAESSPQMEEYQGKWGDVIRQIKEWRDEGIESLEGWQISNNLGMPLSPALKGVLNSHGIHFNTHLKTWIIDDFKIN